MEVVVEILSQSTEQHVRGFQFEHYAQEGVEEYD